MSVGDARAIDSVGVRGELAGLSSHLPLCAFSSPEVLVPEVYELVSASPMPAAAFMNIIPGYVFYNL